MNGCENSLLPTPCVLLSAPILSPPLGFFATPFALRLQGFPRFDASYAANDWERDFLHSVALQMAAGRPLSEKQGGVLRRIAGRGRRGGGAPAASAASGAPARGAGGAVADSAAAGSSGGSGGRPGAPYVRPAGPPSGAALPAAVPLAQPARALPREA